MIIENDTKHILNTFYGFPRRIRLTPKTSLRLSRLGLLTKSEFVACGAEQTKQLSKHRVLLSAKISSTTRQALKF